MVSIFVKSTKSGRFVKVISSKTVPRTGRITFASSVVSAEEIKIVPEQPSDNAATWDLTVGIHGCFEYTGKLILLF